MQFDDEFGAIDDLEGAVRGGTRAVLVAQVASQFLSLGVLAVMYRLVAPDDYGLLGRLLPAVMLPRMAATLGLATAVAQHPQLSRSQLTQLFWMNVMAGAFAAGITAVAAPILARVYDRPLLTWLGLAMAGCNLLASLGNHHQALLERTLRLGRLSFVRIAALGIGGVAGIAVALVRGDVWAIVAMQGAELAALAVGVWIAMPWRPERVDQREPIGQLVRFSSFYSLSTLVNYLGQNLEKIILPVLLGGMADRAIGLYSQAFSLAIKPVYLITSPLVGVMVSALARMRQDGAAYTDLVTRFFRLAAIGLFPCAAGLTAVAPDLILVLAGPDWAEAGPLLSAMAPAVFAIGLINLAGVLLASVGRAGQLLFASALYCVLLAQGFFAGYYAGGQLGLGDASGESWYGGVIGAAVAFTVVTVGVWLPPFLWFCFRTAGVRTAVVLRALGPAMRSALLMGMVVWGLRRVLLTMEGVPAWLRLVVLVASGVLLYFVLARGEIRWFLDEWIHLRDRKPAQPTKRG